MLLGLLSKAIPARMKQHEAETTVYMSLPEQERHAYMKPIQPLRVIIMSATMRVDDFFGS